MSKLVKNIYLLYKLVLKTILHYMFCLKAAHFLCYIELPTQFIVYEQKNTIFLYIVMARVPKNENRGMTVLD